MIRFTAFGSGGNLALTTQIRSAALADGSQASGLESGVELRCDLDVPADQVRVMISSVDDRVTVAGLDASNRIVAQQLGIPLGSARLARSAAFRRSKWR
jgi:hypothetical protein